MDNWLEGEWVTVSQLVYLSLGSNVGDRKHHLRQGVAALGQLIGDISVSSWYETAPIGETAQPWFVNLALVGKTTLLPRSLLLSLQDIERSVGRRPTYRWGPRVLDIDIVLYGDCVVEESDLTVPHPRMMERAFVLVPLAEIAPDVIHPANGSTMVQLAQGIVGSSALRRLGPFDACP